MSKKGVDLIDIPALERRGVIKLPKKTQALPKYSGGYFDLSATENQTSIPLTNTSSENSQTTDINPFNFLDSLASASTTPATSPYSNLDFSDLKVKFEDLEYKLERFLERIVKIESKLDVLEKK